MFARQANSHWPFTPLKKDTSHPLLIHWADVEGRAIEMCALVKVERAFFFSFLFFFWRWLDEGAQGRHNDEFPLCRVMNNGVNTFNITNKRAVYLYIC